MRHLEQAQPAKTEESQTQKISYGNIELPLAQDRSNAPDPEVYKDFIEDEFSLEYQRLLAMVMDMREPALFEGGTSLGKTYILKKMCAELGYEVHHINLNGHTEPADLMGKYIPNVNKVNPEDPNFIFSDGPVTSALRKEGGKIKVLILDEYNATPNSTLIRMHNIIDEYKVGGSIDLTEDGNETIQIDRDSLKIIALTNPAGSGFSDREPLDPAQIRRFLYQKLPNELPASAVLTYVSALFLGTETMSPQTKDGLELKEIPHLVELIPEYIAIHNTLSQLLKTKALAASQTQRFTFDIREEPRRVRDYIARYYNGDIAQTMQEAMTFVYTNKLETDIDKAKANELIRKLVPKESVNTNRKGLDGSSPMSLETISFKMLARLRDSGYLDTSFESRELHPLSIDPLTKHQAITAYKASSTDTWVWDELEANMPYTVPSTAQLEVAILNFSKSISTDDALSEMDALGVRPLTYEELIQYAIEYPEHQKQKTLVALGSQATVDGVLQVPLVNWSGGERNLNANDREGDWNDNYRFLVVAK